MEVRVKKIRIREKDSEVLYSYEHHCRQLLIKKTTSPKVTYGSGPSKTQISFWHRESKRKFLYLVKRVPRSIT